MKLSSLPPVIWRTDSFFSFLFFNNSGQCLFGTLWFLKTIKWNFTTFFLCVHVVCVHVGVYLRVALELSKRTDIKSSEWAQRKCKWEGRVSGKRGRENSRPEWPKNYTFSFFSGRADGSSGGASLRVRGFVIISYFSHLPPSSLLHHLKGKSGQCWYSLKLPPAGAERELDLHVECVFHWWSAGPNDWQKCQVYVLIFFWQQSVCEALSPQDWYN